MSYTQNFRILNPVLKLRWAGWESTTLALQRAGWLLSAEQDIAMHTIHFALNHPQLKMYGLSDRLPMEYMRYGYTVREGKEYYSNIEIPIKTMSSDLRVQIINQDFSHFHPINTEPQCVRTEIKRIEDFKIFAPINTPEHQIIIDPNDTQRMLNRIIEFQSPRQAEIREKRNREIREFMRENVGITESIKTEDRVLAEILV